MASEPIVSIFDARLWLYGAAMAAVFGAVLVPLRGAVRWRAVVGIIWFFGALGTGFRNLAAIPFWMQDRYGVFRGAGIAAGRGGRRARGWIERFSGGAETFLSQPGRADKNVCPPPLQR